MPAWIPTTQSLPPEETPVLIVWKGAAIVIGERRWEHPNHEESFKPDWYWDDPSDDGQDWGRDDVTHWMHLPPLPGSLNPVQATQTPDA